MIAKLVVTGGKTTKRVVELKLPTVLGRSREADVTVAHPLISRRHCEMFEEDGLLMLRDLASLNGTTVGGRRIVLAALLPEGEFAIGPLSFRVLYRYEGDPASAPPTIFVDEGEANLTEEGGSPVGGAADGLDMQFEEALAAGPAEDAHSGKFHMDDLLAMADADPHEAFPAEPALPPSLSRKAAASKSPAGKSRLGKAAAKRSPAPSSDLSWPPVAHDKLPTIPMPHGNPHEPPEIDSSLESGGHGIPPNSPWAAETPDVAKPHASRVAKRPKAPPAIEQVSEADSLPEPEDIEPDDIQPTPPPPLRTKKKAPTKPAHQEDADPEIGNFLEGLQ